MFICWGAQAGLYHYGIKKHTSTKSFAAFFPHEILLPSHPLIRGI